MTCNAYLSIRPFLRAQLHAAFGVESWRQVGPLVLEEVLKQDGGIMKMAFRLRPVEEVKAALADELGDTYSSIATYLFDGGFGEVNERDIYVEYDVGCIPSDRIDQVREAVRAAKSKGPHVKQLGELLDVAKRSKRDYPGRDLFLMWRAQDVPRPTGGVEMPVGDVAARVRSCEPFDWDRTEWDRAIEADKAAQQAELAKKKVRAEKKRPASVAPPSKVKEALARVDRWMLLFRQA